jgi:hypothetical protein
LAQRLDTRLSRILMDDGVIDASALEEAVQQQLVHGGALDTILLELGAVDEVTLSAALCRAWDTAAVDDDAWLKPASDAAAKLPRRMAARMGLLPYASDDDGLHVLVGAPLDRDLIEEVAELTGERIVPHVVPDVRVQQAIARAHGSPLDERARALLASLDPDAEPLPAPEAEAEAEEDAGARKPDQLAKDAKKWELVDALAHLAAQTNREGIARVAVSYARSILPFAAVFGVRGGQALGWDRLGHCEGAQFGNLPLAVPDGSILEQLLESPSPQVGKPPVNDGNASLFGWLGRRRPQTAVLIPIVVAGRSVGVLYADGGVRTRDAGALSDLVSFGARVGPAFEALLRQRHQENTEIFEERQPAGDESAEAEAEPEAPAQPPATAGSPRDGTSPFAQGYQQKDAAAGDDGDEDLFEDDDEEEEDDLFDDAGAIVSDSIKDLTAKPALSGARLELLPSDEPMPEAGDLDDDDDDDLDDDEDLFEDEDEDEDEGGDGDAGEDDGDDHEFPVADYGVSVEYVGEVKRPAGGRGNGNGADASLPVVFGEVVDRPAAATGAWQGALTDTVSAGHQGGEAASDEPILADSADESWDDVVLDAANARTLESEPKQAPTSGPRIEAARPAPPDEVPDEDEEEERHPAQLVAELESLDARAVGAAKARLIALGEEAIDALKEKFPGRLLVDPFAEKHPPDSAEELGPLVEVLDALGTTGHDAAIPHLDSRFAAHRYAATFLFAQHPDERSLELLRPRLHDQEPRVRKLAAAALSHYVAHPDFEAVLAHLRNRLTSPAPEARARAIWFLGYFRDVGSVPQLIELLNDGGDVGKAARKALKQITLQDFGELAKSWQKWWRRGRKRSRIDWLIDGLRSKDRDLRYIASTELSRLSGDSFGYRYDDPRRERDNAIRIFEEWWKVERQRAAQ